MRQQKTKKTKNKFEKGSLTHWFIFLWCKNVFQPLKSLNFFFFCFVVIFFLLYTICPFTAATKNVLCVFCFEIFPEDWLDHFVLFVSIKSKQKREKSLSIMSYINWSEKLYIHLHVGIRYTLSEKHIKLQCATIYNTEKGWFLFLCNMSSVFPQFLKNSVPLWWKYA